MWDVREHCARRRKIVGDTYWPRLACSTLGILPRMSGREMMCVRSESFIRRAIEFTSLSSTTVYSNRFVFTARIRRRTRRASGWLLHSYPSCRVPFKVAYWELPDKFLKREITSGQRRILKIKSVIYKRGDVYSWSKVHWTYLCM